MINTFLDGLFLALMTSMIAAVYRGVLAYEEPFSAWWRFGNRFEGRWFFKPVWACEKCFAGQITLWVYLGLHVRAEKCPGTMLFHAFPAVSVSFQGYSLLQHLFAIAAAIFFAPIFTRIINQNEH